MADFSTPQPGSDILAGYQKATRLSPISETAKNTVLKDYGVSAGWSKGKSDTAISTEAADKVLAKFNKDQAALQPKGSAAGKNGVPAVKDPEVRKVTYAQSNRQKGETLSAAYNRLYGQQLQVLTLQRLGMYNGPVKNPYTIKTDTGIYVTPDEARTKYNMDVPKNTAGTNVSVNASTVKTVLQNYGLPLTSNPPTYALGSFHALDAWAKRARAYMLTWKK